VKKLNIDGAQYNWWALNTDCPIQTETGVFSSKRRYQLKRDYGLSVDDYNAIFAEQQGKCAICGRHQQKLKKGLVVDHNHKTGEVRGLLCFRCNNGLGSFKDDIEQLRMAIIYLNKQ